MLAQVRSLAFNVFFYGGTLVFAVAGILLLPIPSPGPLRGILRGWARTMVWAMRWIGGMAEEVRDFDRLPARGPALIAMKHQSESDGISLAALIPGIAFVAMQELFRYPLVGAILYRLQMIRVDTCGGGRERERLATFAARAHAGARHIAIYPEGHLMAIGERERYRSGIFYLYRDFGLPVTPVATCVGLLWNRRDWVKRPGRAAIEFLPAIPPGLDKDAFMQRLESDIEAATVRLVAEFTGRPVTPSVYVSRSGESSGPVASVPRARP
ncbi:MAG: 1-acyl-sn-glycerol-3-phosphate acyltransferase [Alphaproteobacteria bacterium]|nr:1-acyl-sn-glycerol-3-phosphate acyltransferase [Alphaproteobacteria bacterium]